ncbi:MAG: YbhB/YbcL family Raf kinase inhibitor-like protein [Duodenibacillus sp.]|nr:YbhB/YbcL family Raf kinase inhibitor-like protein [Duodenibacillus sp.]
MRIYSTAFDTGGAIPMKNTQEAEDLSPELIFEQVPVGTKSLVLIADDPDAPDPKAPKRIWLHWLLINLPANTKMLAEGVQMLPPGTVAGMNDSGNEGWAGPRPPIGTHRYFFKLYALDCVLDVPPRPFGRAPIEKAMQGHVIESAETFGTYLLSTNR